MSMTSQSALLFILYRHASIAKERECLCQVTNSKDLKALKKHRVGLVGGRNGRKEREGWEINGDGFGVGCLFCWKDFWWEEIR